MLQDATHVQEGSLASWAHEVAAVLGRGIVHGCDALETDLVYPVAVDPGVAIDPRGAVPRLQVLHHAGEAGEYLVAARAIHILLFMNYEMLYRLCLVMQ